jgi:hypothetical protein
MPIRDYDQFFETTGRIAKAETVAEAWTLATAATAPMRWAPGLACFLPGPRETFAETVLAHSLPQSWIARYSAERYELIDPVFERASATRMPFTMDEAFSGKLTKRQRQLRDEATAGGFTSAFVIPDFSQGRCALIAFAGPAVPLLEKDRLALHLSLSEKTINEYVERAKHKLDVPTRMQAIVLAIRLGSIRV